PGPSVVQLGKLEQPLRFQVLVKEPQGQDRKDRKDQIEEHQEHVVIHVLSREPAVELEPEEDNHKDNVFVKGEQSHLGCPQVRPPSVHQEETGQEAKLAHGIVTRHYCLLLKRNLT